jgi:hypothetical protein
MVCSGCVCGWSVCVFSSLPAVAAKKKLLSISRHHVPENTSPDGNASTSNRSELPAGGGGDEGDGVGPGEGGKEGLGGGGGGGGGGHVEGEGSSASGKDESERKAKNLNVVLERAAAKQQEVHAARRKAEEVGRMAESRCVYTFCICGRTCVGVFVSCCR